MCQTCSFSRRAVLAGLGASALSACSQNPITGERQFIAIGEGELQQLSAQSWQQIRNETQTVRSSAVKDRIGRITERILRACGEGAENWEVRVFDDEAVNAFALPGGKIGVNSGLLDVAETDAQLATVIAHEVGHVNARHAAERVSRQMLSQLGVQVGAAALNIGTGIDPRAGAAVLGAGAQYGIALPFSRAQESQADRLGLRCMAEAGYNPEQAIDLWQNMARANRNSPPQFLSTHPSAGSRIEDIRAMLPEVMPIYRRNA